MNEEQLRAELDAVYRSSSWRITAPLRWCGLQLRRLREDGVWAYTKLAIKKIILPFGRRLTAFVDTHPNLRNRAVVLTQRLGLYRSLHWVYMRLAGSPPNIINITQASGELLTLSQLTPRSLEIYVALKLAINNKLSNKLNNKQDARRCE